MDILYRVLSYDCSALGDSSCSTPVCPGSRQVVATCCVNDTTGFSSTTWKGTSIVGCAFGDLIILAHFATNATHTCPGTITARFASVEVPVYTTELSMVPTSSNDGDTVGCYFPTPNDLIHQCTLDVLCELLLLVIIG